jgi:hypothetical protein
MTRVTHNLQADRPPRKRAARQEIRSLHTALELVAPLNSQINGWQSTVAHLIVVAEHAQRHDMDDTAYLKNVASLETTVRANWERLARELIDLPADIRDHSRVADTRRAVESVLLGLERARKLLQ